MTARPTATEMAAIKAGYAALQASDSPNSNIVETIVIGLGDRQMLMSPETADELQTLRARVAELEASPAPAMPWATTLDADDLEGLLADIADAATGDDDLNTLKNVEDAIAQWRSIADADEAQRNAPGPATPDGPGEPS